MATKQTQHSSKHQDIIRGLERSIELMNFASGSGVRVKKVIVQGDEPQLIFEGDEA